MAIDGATYTTGTATVAAGATAVTGTGTDWLTAGLKPGDQFSAGGLAVTIATVVSNSSLTLVAGWPGAALNAAAYEIRFVDAASRALAKTIDLLAKLGNGNIGSLADLQTAANKLAYYNGAGSAALTDLTGTARTLLAQTTQALMRTTGLGMSSIGSGLAVAASAAAGRSLLTDSGGMFGARYFESIPTLALSDDTMQVLTEADFGTKANMRMAFFTDAGATAAGLVAFRIGAIPTVEPIVMKTGSDAFYSFVAGISSVAAAQDGKVTISADSTSLRTINRIGGTRFVSWCFF